MAEAIFQQATSVTRSKQQNAQTRKLIKQREAAKSKKDIISAKTIKEQLDSLYNKFLDSVGSGTIPQNVADVFNMYKASLNAEMFVAAYIYHELKNSGTTETDEQLLERVLNIFLSKAPSVRTSIDDKLAQDRESVEEDIRFELFTYEKMIDSNLKGVIEAEWS